MRTAQISAVLSALLVSASNANATVSFTVSGVFDADPAQEVDVSVTLTNMAADDIVAFAFDWLLDGANVPLRCAAAGFGWDGPEHDLRWHQQPVHVQLR